jgi:hypothetical protein
VILHPQVRKRKVNGKNKKITLLSVVKRSGVHSGGTVVPETEANILFKMV